jgi:ankyrin repeat protein
MQSSDPNREILSDALRAGDPTKVAAVIEAGAEIKYRDANGYDALIDAVHGRDLQQDSQLIDLLDLLVKHGVALSGVSSYNESGLRVLSRVGRFDAVRFLLNAGADPAHLQWTPLIEAVALGVTD